MGSGFGVRGAAFCSGFRVLGSGFGAPRTELRTRTPHPEPRTEPGTPNPEPRTRSLFVNGPRLPPAVIAAIRADAVRRLRLVAVGTLRKANGPERIVRATLRSSRFRMTSFW